MESVSECQALQALRIYSDWMYSSVVQGLIQENSELRQELVQIRAEIENELTFLDSLSVSSLDDLSFNSQSTIPARSAVASPG